MKRNDLLELPWTDVADDIGAGNDTVMIPAGSLEKHGCPVLLGAGSYTTTGSVERVSPKALCSSRISFVLLHHMSEPGCGTGDISPPAEIYRQDLYPIGSSLIFASFNRPVFISHHTNMAQGGALCTLRAETSCFHTTYDKTPPECACAVMADPMAGLPPTLPAGKRMVMVRNPQFRVWWKGCKSRMGGMDLRKGWPTGEMLDGSDGRRRAEGKECFSDN